MQMAHETFAEAIKEAYEDGWTSRSNVVDIFKVYTVNTLLLCQK